MFTGERPGWGGEFDYDEARHLAAYRHASTLASGKRVLDAGCGEGFGTQLLADVAIHVVGLDYSEEAVAFCQQHWLKPNLEFVRRDLTEAGHGAGRFDLVLNFQVLEHIRDERPFLEALRSRLENGGRVLLTTPNRLMSFSENPYHVREYTAAELEELLRGVFPTVRVRGMHGTEKVLRFDQARARSVRRILRLDPFGLRNRLPDWLVHRAFAKLAGLVRRQARATTQEEGITPDDFFVCDERLDRALDLVAECS